MFVEQSNISFVVGVTVRCSVKSKIIERCWIHLTTLSRLLDSRMLSVTKVRKRTPRNGLNTKAGIAEVTRL